MSELKPCPFCGGIDMSVLDDADYLHGDRFPFAVVCHECGAYGSSERTASLAVEAWNTRADDYRQAAEYWQHMYEEAFAERTCKNVGYYIDSTRFKCSNCGYNGWTKWAKDGEDRVPNYCPNCGAKVVSE